ncbi:MAG: hypothetical protein OIF50_12155 [Flavobacteriaceae bacterium]|nr:hypothetical protein [Flavobacteriaceae bacterium]
MDIALLFIVAFCIALIAMLLPGMLNITAAKIGLEEGKLRAYTYAGGVCITVILQTLLAIQFAHFINNNPHLNAILQKIAVFVFLSVSFYFFNKGNKQAKLPIANVNLKSKKSHFFSGLFMAFINVLPIPFQSFMTATIGGHGIFDFSTKATLIYLLGTGLGTMLMLHFYILFFHKYRKQNKENKGKNNYLIAIVTLGIAIATIIRILSR